MSRDRLHFEYVDDFRPMRFVKSPSVGADAWANAAPTAATNYTAGIDAYTGDWATATKNQQNVMLQNVTTAVQNGKWAAGIDKVGTSGWKQRTKDKVANYSNGYNTGKNAYLAAAQTLYPYIGAGQAQLAGMAKGTLAASKARVNFWMDYMSAYSG